MAENSMKQCIFVNYAHEDQAIATPIMDGLKAMGVQILTGSAGEEKLGSVCCLLNILTDASAASRSFKKVIGSALRQGLPSLTVKAGENGIETDLFDLALTLGTVMKYKYEKTAPEAVKAADAEAATASAAAETSVTNLQSAAGVQTGDEDAAADAVFEEVTRQDAEQLSKEDCYRAAMAYMNGEGVQADLEKAVDLLKLSAHKGYVDAQYELCACYSVGRGVKRNIVEAAKWCEMAAYSGHVQAQSEIGYCYECGHGVTRNIKEAVRWYQAAANQGNADAKNNLAFCYQKARGVARNMDKALTLYREAAESGHSSAQYNLGFCYWYGEGVEIDKERAIGLFEKSAENGNAKAAQMLKILNQHMYIKQKQ